MQITVEPRRRSYRNFIARVPGGLWFYRSDRIIRIAFGGRFSFTNLMPS